MRVSLGANAAQVNVDEVVLGLWRFANALGLLTDVIGERTAAAGVTVDGLLIKDSGIPEAAVTAHEAALAILESQIADGSILARLAADETIAGLWTFANVLGLKTDEITERTLNLGVAVDGLVIKDAGIPEAAVTAHEAALSIAGTQIPSLPVALVTAHEAALAILESQIADGSIFGRLADTETIAGTWTFTPGINLLDRMSFIDIAFAANNILVSAVVGESDPQFGILASGLMSWGSGAAARDTNLYRDAADVLKTDDSFHVGATLRALGTFEASISSYTLSARADDRATGGKMIQRISLIGAQDLTGFVAPAGPELLIVSTGVTGFALTLKHEDGNSVAANRIIGPSSADFTLPTQGGVLLYYDTVSSRWRFVGHT